MNFKYCPKDFNELRECIKKEIFEVQGTPDKPNREADLNCIDTSLMRVMHFVFLKFDFNGDISRWNVKNVIRFENMFCESKFNGDIGGWKNDYLEKTFKTNPWFANSLVPSFPHNFSTYVFFKNNNLPVYHNKFVVKDAILLKIDEKNILKFKEFVKLPAKIQTFETLSMAIKYSDDFNFTYKKIVQSIDSKYFTKTEVNDIYFLLGKVNDLDTKELKNYKNSLKAMTQKTKSIKYVAKILAYNDFMTKDIDILDKYKKILEVKNNEEKEVLKALLFSGILKSKKGSL